MKRRASMTCTECSEPATRKGMCLSHYNKARYAANRPEMLAKVKAWQAANPDKVAASSRKSKLKHAERCRATERRSHLKRVNNPRVFNGEPVTTAEVTYIGAHRRVAVNRGLARLYECPCGAHAEEWAWTHVVNEFTRQGMTKNYQGAEVLSRYSLNVWNYIARCHRCHSTYDKYGYMLMERTTA